MKLLLFFILYSTTVISVISQPLGIPSISGLPDDRFRVRASIDASLLPVDATLMNVLHFMSVIAKKGYNQQLDPRTYSARDYRQVQISSYAVTEVRFLLWGLYLGIQEMLGVARFHGTKLDLYWEGEPVGQIKIASRVTLNLPGSGANNTRNLLVTGQQLNFTENDEGSVYEGSKRTAAWPMIDLTKSEDEENASTIIPNQTENDTANVTLAYDVPLPLNISNNVSSLLSFTLDLMVVPGATVLGRNTVFLTFYTALLHVAQFSTSDELVPFEVMSPIDEKIKLSVYRGDIGCWVRNSWHMCFFNRNKMLIRS